MYICAARRKIFEKYGQNKKKCWAHGGGPGPLGPSPPGSATEYMKTRQLLTSQQINVQHQTVTFLNRPFIPQEVWPLIVTALRTQRVDLARYLKVTVFHDDAERFRWSGSGRESDYRKGLVEFWLALGGGAWLAMLWKQERLKFKAQLYLKLYTFTSMLVSYTQIWLT